MRKFLKIFHKLCAWWPYYILTIASLVGVKALFHEGLFSAHDIWHQVARLYWYTEALDDGQIMPTFISSLFKGYGYPLFIFSYHFPWIIAYPLMKLGLYFEVVMKILFGLSFFLSWIFMYGLSFEIFKSRLAAVTSAFLYLWAPYHFLTIFVSAAIGTAYAFVFLPMLFWGLYIIIKDVNKLGIVLCAVGIAGLVLSHMMTLVMTIPLLLMFICAVFLNKKWKRKEFFIIVRGLLSGGLWGIGMSAFYLLPLFFYRNTILAADESFGFKNHYQNYFVTLKQLIYSPWGFGPLIGKAIEGGMSFQVGIAQWISVGLLILLAVLKKFRLNLIWAGSLLLMFASVIFLMTESSKGLWNVTSNLFALDYPFRLLLMAVMVGSLIAAMVITLLPTKLLKFVLTVILLSIAVYTNRNHIRVNMYTHYPLADYIGAEITTNTYSEYLPKTSRTFDKTQEYRLIRSDEIFETSDVFSNTRELTFKVNVIAPTQSVIIGQLYWPDNYLYIDGIETKYSLANMGEIQTVLNKGIHNIRVINKQSQIMKIGLYITILSLISICTYVLMVDKYGEK